MPGSVSYEILTGCGIFEANNRAQDHALVGASDRLPHSKKGSVIRSPSRFCLWRGVYDPRLRLRLKAMAPPATATVPRMAMSVARLLPWLVPLPVLGARGVPETVAPSTIDIGCCVLVEGTEVVVVAVDVAVAVVVAVVVVVAGVLGDVAELVGVAFVGVGVTTSIGDVTEAVGVLGEVMPTGIWVFVKVQVTFSPSVRRTLRMFPVTVSGMFVTGPSVGAVGTQATLESIQPLIVASVKT
jgi:hypothetical protein